MTLFLLDKIKNTDKHYNNIFNSNDYSPLWNRIYGNLVINKNNDNEICNNLITPLQFIYNVGKIYVGHTPNIQSGISSTCNNNIWLTDYGASKAFNKFYLKNNKHIQILEILNDGKKFNILKEHHTHKSKSIFNITINN